MTQLLPNGSPSGTGSLTPGRRTRAVFDRSETVVVESAWGGTRGNTQIAPVAGKDKGNDGRYSTNMYLWSSGAYTLRPRQMDIATVRERELPTALNNQFIYKWGPTYVATVGTMQTVGIEFLTYELWREPIGAGMVSSAISNTEGDPHLRKLVSAGGTFAQTVAANTKVNTFQAALIAKHYASGIMQPLDAVIGTSVDQPTDQGYCLRWEVPGNNSDCYDVILAFHFGQYALSIHGSGDAGLWEYGQVVTGGAFDWDLVKTFRYCNPSRVSGFTHKLLIFPCVGPNGEKLLHFYGAELENTENSHSSTSMPGSMTIGQLSAPHEIVYQWSICLTGKIAGSADNCTKAAPMYLQIRRDIRVLFQLSRLLYPPSGVLIDQPWDAPTVTTVFDFTITPTVTKPTGTDMVSLVRDSDTYSTTVVNKPFVAFTMTSDGFNTPRFWRYTLRRAAGVITSAPTPFTCSVHGNIDCQDGGGDTRRAGGSIAIHDVFGQFPRLKNRGFLPVTLLTDFQPPTGSPVKVVLLRGYAIRPHWTKRGKTGSSFPNWYEYAIPITGMWYRLTKPPLRGMISLKDFAYEPGVAGNPPYKVTDAVKVLLDLAGFPAGQINIPDNPIRLFRGVSVDQSDALYDGTVSLAEMIARLLPNYLGASLYFEDSAGALDTDGVPIGQWTILFPPKGDPTSGYPNDAPPTPVLNFVTTGPVQPVSGFKHPGVLDSYPADTVPCFGNAEGYTDPPEGNHVWALTAPDVMKSGGVKISNHAYNAKSYSVPGWGAASDPESPHYVGMEWPILVADPTLYSGDNLGETQKAVDFITRRVFNYACLARQIETKRGPLVFINDAVTGRWRKPRYYDPVTIDGQAGWYIRNVLVSYRYDRTQMATYELERVVPYTT